MALGGIEESCGDSVPRQERNAARTAGWRPTLLPVGGRWAPRVHRRGRQVRDAAVQADAEAAEEVASADGRAASSGRPAEENRSERSDDAEREGALAPDPASPEAGSTEAGWRRVRPLAGWRLLTWNLQRIVGVAQLRTLIDAITYEDLAWCCMAFQEGGSVGAPADGDGPAQAVALPGPHLLVTHDAHCQVGLIVKGDYQEFVRAIDTRPSTLR